MGGVLRKIFNLYPGEERKAAPFAILALLWSIGGYGFLTLSEGLFLEHVGAHALPPAYLGIAVAMCLLSALLLPALHRLSLHYLLLSVITGAITGSLIIYLLLSLTSFPVSPTFWYFFKILGWIIPVATYTCFWAFIDQYYDLQDAKRFFCLFNSVIFLGDAIAGGLISLFLESVGPSGLIALFILLITASIPVIFFISRHEKAISMEPLEEVTAPIQQETKSFLQTVFRSHFTMILMGFYFLMQILAVVTEYSYMDSFERIFKNTSEENALTEFLGTCGMCVSLGNMLFCMIFYSRLVQKFGISNIILIAPTFFLVVFLLWGWHDFLPFAILGFIAREGMVYTFDDNNLHLLVTAVPTKIKNQVRIFIESFFEPVGMFISASLLLFLQEKSLTLGIILSCMALGVILVLRSRYHKAIFSNLLSNAIRFEKKMGDWISHLSKKERKELEINLLSKLKRIEEPTQLIAYEYLLKMQNPQILTRLLHQLGHLSVPGKLKAIEMLGASNWAQEAPVIEHLEKWRRTVPHPSIRSAIHFYFAKYSLLKPERIFNDLNHDQLELRGAAILSFKTATKQTIYTEVAEQKHESLLHSSDEKELCMGIRILGFEKNGSHIVLLLPFLNHSSTLVKRASARAIALLAGPSYSEHADTILAHLSLTTDSDTRLAYLQILEKLEAAHIAKPLIISSVYFRPSERKLVEKLVLQFKKELLLEDLISILHNEHVHIRARLLAGRLIGKLSLRDLRLRFHPLIKKELRRAYLYYYHAHTIQKQTPSYDLSILEKTLTTGYEVILDFIIQMIGVASALEDSEVLSFTMKSKNRKLRAQALETIEKSCDPKIFTLLRPLLEARGPDERMRKFFEEGGKELDLSELLESLAQSGSIVEQIVSLSYKAHFNAPGWREALQKKLEEEETVFHHFAHELLRAT